MNRTATGPLGGAALSSAGVSIRPRNAGTSIEELVSRASSLVAQDDDRVDACGA
jgi:hypothetical protein